VVWQEHTMAEDIQLLRRYAETRAQDAFATIVERHISLWQAEGVVPGIRTEPPR
jgi:hypothetical protein